MSKIGVVGFGYVGQALRYGFESQESKIYFYDKFKHSSSLKEVVENSEFIFVCVPTPYKDDKIDLRIMDENIDEIARYAVGKDKIIIIKSTVIPGTTRNYAKKYPGCNFCCNPEFLTEANSLQDFMNPDRIIIGVEGEKTKERVLSLYKEHFPTVPIFFTTFTGAEIAKYMANAFLATKVIFANEIYDLCQKLGVNYEDVKNMVAADKRIGASHFKVTKEGGFGGKCFFKDMVALISLFDEHGVDVSLLKTVLRKNLNIRKVRDWESIPFVKSN